ncbi:ribonuclease III [Gimesia chilikensis]|uniref:Ribonuclease 3 n=1 Tax=Gimesia chilikensis TaxID=2605989 RepID=A0A517PXG1_9PLAN|nr:ribonuclease III [Gimesia chilikensis]QDT24065.1 Ribonuclease 3 [Gimesia chilikensis]
MLYDLSPAEIDVLLEECQHNLGYSFTNYELLKCCLTHTSAAKTRMDSNERLEFLGDAILGALVCEKLFHQFPNSPEGELTRIKSAVVSRNTCTRLAREKGLDRFIFVGKGLAMTETLPESLLAGMFEAIIAGIYLDGGMDPVHEFLDPLIERENMKASRSVHGFNYKSLLQQYSQKKFSQTPVYELVDEKGPDHSKFFKVTAIIGENQYEPAWGSTKKEAEQRAALNALRQNEDENGSDWELPSMPDDI